MAKWLYYNDKINVHSNNDYVFRRSCLNNRPKTIRWLLSIENFNDKLITRFQKKLDGEMWIILYKKNHKSTSKNVSKRILKTRTKYLFRLIKTIIILLKLHNKVCNERYAPNGLGYIEAFDHFKSVNHQITSI